MRSLSAHQLGMSASNLLCDPRCEQRIVITTRSKVGFAGEVWYPKPSNIRELLPPGDPRFSDMVEKALDNPIGSGGMITLKSTGHRDE
jgi:hypothetical protein